MNDEYFVDVLKRTLDKYTLPKVADSLRVPHLTIQKWIDGQNYPRENMKKAFIQWCESELGKK